MNTLSVRGLVVRSFLAGSVAGLGIMCAFAARTIWAVTKGGRWYQVRKFL